MSKRITRRTLISSGIGLAALSTLTWLKPYDIGENHAPYFKTLSNTLDQEKIARPTLIVDRERLRQNIATLKEHIYPDFHYRIVAKSLPSVAMLKWISNEAKTKRFMLFDERFAAQVANEIDAADILFGKPLPAKAARNFYQHVNDSNFDSSQQLQWLIDTPERLTEYADLATALDIDLRINIELDVGLHRGGVNNDQTLVNMLQQIDASPKLSFSGFMGYEPHVVKIPGDAYGHLAEAMAIYRQRIAAAEQHFGHALPSSITLNGAGSPSYQLHNRDNSPCNELSTGSCLVKPLDYDLPSLADHQAASFIATPVLKQMTRTELPGVAALGDVMAWWNPNREQAYFTYGGYWKAQPVSPKGLSVNPVFGRSTNQEMLNASHSVDLKPNDWVFLRPTQSEFVFLQFGDIAVYDQGKLDTWWPTFA